MLERLGNSVYKTTILIFLYTIIIKDFNQDALRIFLIIGAIAAGLSTSKELA